MNRKTLVILAALALLSIIALASCAEPTPKVVEKIVEKPVEKVVEKPVTVVVPAPTAAPKPTEAPKPPAPTAKIDIVSVPMNYREAGDFITTTIKYITDTAVGPANAVVATALTGLNNVPINIPVRVAGLGVGTAPVTRTTWTLTVPPGSQAKLKDAAAAKTEFTPDVVGTYKLDLVLANATGSSPMASVKIYAGTFVGDSAKNCVQCHKTKVDEWAKTGHANIFRQELDNLIDGPQGVGTHYAERCAICHTTGSFYTAKGTGGFQDAVAKTGWKFPTFKQIDDAYAKKGPSNWETAPAEIKAMGNIQCEQCHGPASQHLKGEKVMATDMSNGVCDACHNTAGTHTKGLQEQSAKHLTGTTFEEITGPSRQACARCHSGEGYVTFLKNPTNMAAWVNEESYIGCSTCHDPHDDKNFAQLRIVGKPVELPFEAKDVGLSATCFECHNGRTKAADAIRGSFPHYGANSEMLSDTGGVTYGQNVPNSPHGMLIGNAPVPDPADKTGKTLLFGGQKPGPCVVCHMWPQIADSKDPNYKYRMEVGAHSFNTVSVDRKFEYGASCVSCHGPVTDFNLKAKADYDGNGKVEGVQDEIKGLLNAVWKALEAKGVKQSASHPYWVPPRDAQGNVDDKLENAFYNFRIVYGVMWHADSSGKIVPGNEGKSQAAHNFKRSCALLQLSLKDLGATPAGAADCTK